MLKYSWIGPVFLYERDIAPFVRATLPDKYDLSQPPNLTLSTVGLVKNPDSSSDVDECLLGSVPAQKAGVTTEMKVTEVPCSATKITVLRWNVRRKDKLKVGEADAGELRNAIRVGVNQRLQKMLSEGEKVPFSVGLQPGVVEFGELPLVPPAPKVGFGLAGMALIILSSLLRRSP
jgi:hypothetical protein